jgi:hypothetical protein
MGVLGAEDGGLGLYSVLTSICLLQAVYPTLLGWGLVVAIYSVASTIYFYAVTRDLVELARGNQASILLNPTDDAVFVSLLAVLLAIAIAVVLHRPKPFAA